VKTKWPTDSATVGSQAAVLRTMSLNHRDVQLAQVADQLADYYATDPELTAFDAFDKESEGADA